MHSFAINSVYAPHIHVRHFSYYYPSAFDSVYAPRIYVRLYNGLTAFLCPLNAKLSSQNEKKHFFLAYIRKKLYLCNRKGF